MRKVIQFIKHMITHISKTDVFGLSAQLSFFFLLSLFPFLLFLLTLLAYLPIDEAIVLDLIETYAPEQIVSLINSNIKGLMSAQNTGLLSIGILGTLWSASNGVNAIKKAFNRAYEVIEDRSYIVSRLISIAMTIAMVGVITIALLLPIFGEKIGLFVFSFLDQKDIFLSIWNALRWIISSVVIFIVLLALYKLLPNLKVYFKHTIWGALFATIGWQGASLAFSFYVNTLGNYSATYGSLGAVIILMIWFYLSGIIIIIGGVINAVLHNSSAKRASLKHLNL